MTDGSIDALMKAKRKLVEIKHVPLSKDQPYQVLIKRNGVFLHGCKTELEVEAFLLKLPVERLMGGKTSRSKR
jgi:hypothetical protein